MSSAEYNQLLKFLYFEGYADSYEEAESLLEELTDEEFEELCEKAPRPTRLPKSRERNIGHDDWKDPDPDTRDWGERPPAGKKLRSRLISTVGTRRREDIETGVRKEDFDIIAEYLFEEGYADSYEDVEYILEKMSSSGFLRKIKAERKRNRDDLKDLIRRKGPEFFTAPRTSATISARKEEPKPQQSGTPPTNPKNRRIEFIDRSKASDQGNTVVRGRRSRLGEEIENFDVVVEFLFVEGYADTIENAELMAESISEEWVDEIVEKFVPISHEKAKRMARRSANMGIQSLNLRRRDPEKSKTLSSKKGTIDTYHRDLYSSRLRTKHSTGEKNPDYDNLRYKKQVEYVKGKEKANKQKGKDKK